MNQPDGRYDHNAPGERLQPYEYLRPWSSNEERLVQQAISSNILPGAELAAMVRPPLPQVILFPPRLTGASREAPGILDVINADRAYQPRTDYSGSQGSYAGSSRNVLGT